MRSLFEGQTAFEDDISGWNTERVTDMTMRFSRATAFNGDVSGWPA